MPGSPPSATAAKSRVGFIPARTSSGARVNWSGRTSEKASCEGRFAARSYCSCPEVTGGLFQDPHCDSRLLSERSPVDAFMERDWPSGRVRLYRLPHRHAGQHHPLARGRAAGRGRTFSFLRDVRPYSGVLSEFLVRYAAVGRDRSGNGPEEYRLLRLHAGDNHFLDRGWSTGVQRHSLWWVALEVEANSGLVPVGSGEVI